MYYGQAAQQTPDVNQSPKHDMVVSGNSWDYQEIA